MPVASFPTSSLSREHRAWIALYTLQIAPVYRNQVLAQNNVTEADLAEYQESWFRMQVRKNSTDE